jgi:5-bromo-4-chloroindolyl phosphate hydrolysis protein
MSDNISLSQKDLGLLSDLLTYEDWAAKKSRMYAKTLTDPDLQNICKTLEENHTKNFNELYNFLNAF